MSTFVAVNDPFGQCLHDSRSVPHLWYGAENLGSVRIKTKEWILILTSQPQAAGIVSTGSCGMVRGRHRDPAHWDALPAEFNSAGMPRACG